ncbi:unnamed protein product [Alopecurus aequalis]
MASGKDRLSDLPTKEAARAAVLSRRWRRTFADVDAVSFVDPEPPIYGYSRDFAFVKQSEEKRSRSGDLISDVNAALLCRRRCAGHRDTAPPRFFRVHLSRYHCWDDAMLSQWLRYLLKPQGTGQQEALTHLDLRIEATVLGEHLVDEPEDDDDAVGWECPAQIPYVPYGEDPHTWPRYTLPTRLFSAAAVRTLCLGGCMLLDPPKLIHLPLLETLLLSTISNYAARGDTIQRIISACPRLVDLTLECCRYTEKSDPGLDTTYTIAVLDKHLRRLAIRCCHSLVRVCIDASELRVFEYRGAVPAESFLTLHSAHNISSCTIGFCGKMVYHKEFPRLRKFLEHFTATEHLDLVSTYLGAGIESESFPGFPLFQNLRRLELTGYLQRGSIEAMIRILEQAPSIEFLFLFMKPSYQEKNSCSVLQVHSHELRDQVRVPDVSIPCLRNRLRQINLVHYQDHNAQRNVAKLLLCNAMVLERLCVVLPRGPRELQTKLMNEIKGWVVNMSANMIFL